MKTLPALLEADYAAGSRYIGHLLKITRRDGTIFGFTSASADVTIDGVAYSAAPGLYVASLVQSASLTVDGTEITTLDDGSVFDRADVLGGLWRNAAFVISKYNYSTPANGVEPLMAGSFGNVSIERGQVVIELRGLQQMLQQPVGAVVSKTCRSRFGNANGARCGLVLATYTFAFTITAVTDNQTFVCAALDGVHAADYFGEGDLSFVTGNCAGLQQKVKTYLANGTFTLVLPMFKALQVGDTGTVVAGCRKRFAEDCVAKFNNALNFDGEPHLRGMDTLTAPP